MITVSISAISNGIFTREHSSQYSVTLNTGSLKLGYYKSRTLSMQNFSNVRKYLLELSFLALLIRFIFFSSAEIAISLVLISVVLSMAYNRWLEKAKITQYEEIITKMKNDKEELNSLILERSNEITERMDVAFSKIGNLSLDQSIKNVVTSERTQKLQSATNKRLF
jgi:hypothetical protein